MHSLLAEVCIGDIYLKMIEDVNLNLPDQSVALTVDYIARSARLGAGCNNIWKCIEIVWSVQPLLGSTMNTYNFIYLPPFLTFAYFFVCSGLSPNYPLLTSAGYLQYPAAVCSSGYLHYPAAVCSGSGCYGIGSVGPWHSSW